MNQLFVDLDGVLADFDAGYEARFGRRPTKNGSLGDADWRLVRSAKGFYEDLPPMPDMTELWGYVSCLPRQPIILTGVPRNVPEAAENKRAWVRKHLGRNVRVVACQSREKAEWCLPGDVLVDDWEKYMDLWLAAEGLWVTHHSAARTVNSLMALGMV